MQLPRCLPLTSVLLLTACASSEPVGNWIEVPLGKETYWEQAAGFRTGSHEITVPAGKDSEFQVGLQAGAMLIYSWDVAMADPSLLKVEFHGHTERVGDAPGTLMFYKIHSEGRESGTLKAPFAGLHGWYYNNTSAADVVVKLQIAGVYTDGE